MRALPTVEVCESQITTTRYGRLDCYVDVSPDGVYVAEVRSHHDVPLTRAPRNGPGARSVEAAVEELRQALDRD